MDGMQVCQQVRQTSRVPIIMLTAKGEDMDKILGLEYGADDYMTKPFNILEVKVRIKSLFRRVGTPQDEKEDQNVITVRNMVVRLDSRSVTINDKDIPLTAKEFDLLKLFITNRGKVYSREQLLEMVWKYDYLGERTVDVHIRRLREKIEANPTQPEFIHTKWGVGYYFSDK
jgi:DNA-binding response OmpR family regulator